MRRKANSNMVRVWVPQGEEADRLYNELCYEVEGLGRYEVEGRSIRIECHSRRSQSQMLELNGCYVQMETGQHQLRVCVSEPQCSGEELCNIVDQRVEELEEMRALSDDVAFTPVRTVGKEEATSSARTPWQGRGRNFSRPKQPQRSTSQAGSWRSNSSGRSWTESSSSSNSETCRTCRSLGKDQWHSHWSCPLAKARM